VGVDVNLAVFCRINHVFLGVSFFSETQQVSKKTNVIVSSLVMILMGLIFDVCQMHQPPHFGFSPAKNIVFEKVTVGIAVCCLTNSHCACLSEQIKAVN